MLSLSSADHSEIADITKGLADRYDGKRFNSPNDVVEHRDGSVWFTDPPYGGQLYEGTPDAPGGPSNPEGRINNRIGQPPEIGEAKREMPHGVYRVAPDGAITRMIEEAQIQDPNGLCFSPAFDRLYVASTGKGPGDTGAGGKGNEGVSAFVQKLPGAIGYVPLSRLPRNANVIFRC